MAKLAKGFKRVLLDFVGYTLILLAILVGWLPGPGGIPLTMAGLAILSLNNRWAKRIMVYFQREGDRLLDKLFPDDPLIYKLWDRINLAASLLIIPVLIWQPNMVGVFGASALLAINLVIFARNRQRFSRLVRQLKKRRKKS